MAKRKKKAWNNTNPLYRYLHGNQSKKAKKVRKSRGINMAKKRYSRKRSAGVAGFGGNKLMNGIYKPTGMIQQVFNGIAAAHIAGYIPVANDFKYKEEVAGFVAGGIVGGAAVFAVKNLGKISGTSNTTNGSW
jgi:uncharacterized membrane protein YeaQ/YmgE (transglycosylase-associated protein family)